MKKRLFFLFSLFMLTVFIAVSIAENESITLTAFVGQVTVQQSPDTELMQAKQGMSLSQNATIITQDNSFCEIAIDKENSFRIQENTTINIEQLWDELTKKDGKVVRVLRFKLLDGELIAKLDNLPEDTEVSVSSPVAIAGAMGTGFVVRHNATTTDSTVAVTHNAVYVQSSGDPDRRITLSQFQQTQVAPWQTARIQAKGTGILSKKILGKDLVDIVSTSLQILETGKGTSPETAFLDGCQNLSDSALGLKVDPSMSLGDMIGNDTELLEKFFSVIAQAQVVKTDEPTPGTFTATVSLDIGLLNSALGITIPGLTENFAPVTRAEYAKRFGALARVTTERAAKVDAYRKLAERIYGTVISSKTTLKDMEASYDLIKTRVDGLVKGARPVGYTYYSDGSISIRMEILGAKIPESLKPVTGNVFGNNYMASPEPLVFKDFSEYMEMEKK